MLGVYGYKTKKQLRESVGQQLQYVETSMFGSEFKPNGNNVVVGPDAYNGRGWYADVTCSNGVITKVK